jgi:hypothetical protein
MGRYRLRLGRGCSAGDASEEGGGEAGEGGYGRPWGGGALGKWEVGVTGCGWGGEGSAGDTPRGGPRCPPSPQPVVLYPWPSLMCRGVAMAQAVQLEGASHLSRAPHSHVPQPPGQLL